MKKLKTTEEIIQHSLNWVEKHYSQMYWRAVANGGCTKEMSQQGEVAENTIRAIYGLGLKPDSDGPDGGIDLTIDSISYDVKAIGYDKGTPNNNWYANLSAHQAKTKCDNLIFVAVDRKDYSNLHYIGRIKKKTFLERATFLRKGEENPHCKGTGFKARNDMYTIKYGDLNNDADFIS